LTADFFGVTRDSIAFMRGSIGITRASLAATGGSVALTRECVLCGVWFHCIQA
jgi:hypothetical protein